MIQYPPLHLLPTEEDLPFTDDRPVDNELQIIIPAMLRSILAMAWGDRLDWFLGVNIGLYYDWWQGNMCCSQKIQCGCQNWASASGWK